MGNISVKNAFLWVYISHGRACKSLYGARLSQKVKKEIYIFSGVIRRCPFTKPQQIMQSFQLAKLFKPWTSLSPDREVHV